MAEPAGPFRLLRAAPGRFLCYCRPGLAETVCVTDAVEVWAAELGGRPPLGCRCLPREHGTKLREALERGTAELSLSGGKATLRPRDGDCCSALELFKLPVAEARSQLQALVFGMAGRVESLERRLEAMETLASSGSPAKNTARNQQLLLPDPSPRKNRSADSALPAKRRIPGESLINPGFKRRQHLEWILRTPDLCCSLMTSPPEPHHHVCGYWRRSGCTMEPCGAPCAWACG
ncbi:protein PAXX isoform X2 [Melanerpes formicivorus]|uniref:protein PAXX isoform X2 n=1 Tax=Melanerpes formicivorus TaxID=211600 RepID=UPI00358F2D6A